MKGVLNSAKMKKSKYQTRKWRKRQKERKIEKERDSQIN